MTDTTPGYWWLPAQDRETDAIAGTLRTGEGQLPVLELMGSLADDPRPLEVRREHVILGVSETGRQMTLLQCEGSTGIKQENEQLYSERWIGQAALLGAHARNPEEARFMYADLELDVLTSVMPSGIDRGRDAGGNTINWSWVRPEPVVAELEHVRIAVDVAPHGGFAHGGTHELRFWAVPRVRMQWTEPVNLQTVLEDGMYAMADFFSLLAAKPAAIERVLLYRADAPPDDSRFGSNRVELITNPSRRVSDPSRQARRLFALDAAPVELSAMIRNWYDLRSRHDDIEDLLNRYFTQDGRPSPFHETTFLGLAVFLEGYHKLVFGPTEDQHYRDRLLHLFGRIAEVVDSARIDPEVLAEVCRDTRNYLAHGTRRTDDRSVSGGMLQPLNETLDLTIRSLLVHELGVAGDDLEAAFHIPCVHLRRLQGFVPWALLPDSDAV